MEFYLDTWYFPCWLVSKKTKTKTVQACVTTARQGTKSQGNNKLLTIVKESRCLLFSLLCQDIENICPTCVHKREVPAEPVLAVNCDPGCYLSAGWAHEPARTNKLLCINKPHESLILVCCFEQTFSEARFSWGFCEFSPCCTLA